VYRFFGLLDGLSGVADSTQFRVSSSSGWLSRLSYPHSGPEGAVMSLVNKDIIAVSIAIGVSSQTPRSMRLLVANS